MTLSEALTEEQCTIIARSLDDSYDFEQSINDIDLIADLTEMKLRIKNKLK